MACLALLSGACVLVCMRVHVCLHVYLWGSHSVPVVRGHRRLTASRFSTPCRMRTIMGLSGRRGPAFPPGLAGPSWADTPKSCSRWSGCAGCAAWDRTRVTRGLAVSLALVERHCPLCLGSFSSQLASFCSTC